nr:reverse transcriptase domain-containing protein [Tanacetum cinerariifolium]
MDLRPCRRAHDKVETKGCMSQPDWPAALREYCDKNYHQLLPIIAEKVHQEKVQQERLKAVKSHLNFEEASQHSESRTSSKRRDLKKRLGHRHARSMFESPEPRHSHAESPMKRYSERKMVFKRLEKGVFHKLGDKGKSMSAYSNDSRCLSYDSSRIDTKSCYRSSRSREIEFASKNIMTKEHPHEEQKRCRKAKVAQVDIGSQSQRGKSRVLRTTCPIYGYVKKWILSLLVSITLTFQKPECLAITRKSIDIFDDLKEAFLENYLQQKNASKFRLKFTISSREMGNLWNNSCGEAKLQQGRIPKPTKAGAKARHIHSPYKNTKRNFGFGQRKAVTFNQRIKEKQWKRPGKCGKKGETSGKEKPLEILMVHSWQRVAKQKITQTFSLELVISFSPLGEEDGMEGPMIIEAEIREHFVHSMYVDEGSSSKILYEHCLNRFCPEVRSHMIPVTTPLVEFSGEIIWPLGQISLLVKISDEEHSKSAWMNFMVVRSPSPYNEIIKRPGVRKIQAVPSTAHKMLKFPVAGRTVTLQSSMIIPLECTMVSGPGVPQPVINQVTKEKIQVAIHPEYPEQTIAVGSTLTEEGRKKLQKKRGHAPERNKAIYEEVEKLVEAGIMKEVHYHSWLSNSVMVKKHDGSWRMCGSGPQFAISKVSEGCAKAKWEAGKPRQIPWTAKAKSAFKQMKKSIADLCMLTAPKEKEELIIYLAAAKEAVSAIPMTKGWEANAYLLRQSCIIGPKNQLHSDGKVDTCPTNGLVERANRSLGEGIKAMLDERSKNWLEEVSHVLWVHRTMIKSSNRETPFSLTYGTEAVILVEIGMPTLRTAKAAIQEAKRKAKMEKYYNTRVRNTSFMTRDFVYQNNEASHAEEGGKLRPKWEKPYEVMEALGRGAYKLRGRNGSILP